VALAGAAAALAALLVFRSRPVASPVDEVQTSAADLEAAEPDDDEEALPDEPESVPMPPVHLPLLGLLGVVLMMIGWMGMAFMAHLPTAVGVLPAPMAVNLVLGALGGALTAALYSWFTTGNLNSLMSARGMAAGLVVVAAGAPFIPAWSALAAGLVVGFLLPPLIYLFNRVLHLDDSGGALATFALPAIYGAGWNETGLENFLGVAGQGVSGLLVAPGFAPNWPAQIYAQLVGAIAIFVWSLGLSWLLMRSLAGLIHAWERTGLEFGTPPEPVATDEEAPPMQGDALEAGEEGVPGLVGGQEIGM
jgi:Amt family ammonium transporter